MRLRVNRKMQIIGKWWMDREKSAQTRTHKENEEKRRAVRKIMHTAPVPFTIWLFPREIENNFYRCGWQSDRGITVKRDFIFSRRHHWLQCICALMFEKAN